MMNDMATPLLNLPTELVQHIFTFLDAHDLANVAPACRRLRDISYDDRIWHPIVNHFIPNGISEPSPAKSFRELYIGHHPHWFLTKQKIWFGDTEPMGKLLLARFDQNTGAITAHSIAASRGPNTLSYWEKDPEVIIHSFEPRVMLDLHKPAMRLDLNTWQNQHSRNGNPSDRGYAPASIYSKEILMETFSESGLYSSFLLCRDLPKAAIKEQTAIWPPLRFPASGRARNDSKDRYSSAGHRPSSLDKVSQNNFRIRKWVEYTGRRTIPSWITFSSGSSLSAALGVGMPYFANGLGSTAGGMDIRMPEDITTYASMPESCYTSTPQKPWQGIWCGDYSGHGCEFLVITQPDPDQEQPLPERMDWLREWFRGGRRGSVGSNQSFVSAMEELLDLPEGTLTEAGTDVGYDSLPASPSSAMLDVEDAPTGRIEAIKLTGDPNIPRGEYTFIAPDIGHGGFIRIADEEMFQGARVVRSAGHMAGRGFQRDQYTPSQLIMISHDRLAQFWEGFGHISYYQRVDLDALMKFETTTVATRSRASTPEPPEISNEIEMG
ncbi:hypothetical protein AC578_3594 [Pseudocercospora eumusae]|uniref:F-box domain-containing protein n=1 Tax=Pseudocercospora eumusae TaxID=321146 RepID=A0A139HPM0_9PEZI|nr:hypothetical protein AC578_3594 [Pseudocercospora eumusae]